MYSLVLMMALGPGAEAPASNDLRTDRPLDQSRQLHRCFGGRGGCYNGCYGCSSGYYGTCRGGCRGGVGGGMACTGCYGTVIVYPGCRGGAACTGCAGKVMPKIPEPAPKPKVVDPDKPPPEVRVPRPAVIVVSLPTNARLTIDDLPTRSTAATRTFVSPPLEPGQTFTYTLKAEINRNGQSVAETREVAVRAGQESHVRFDFPVLTRLAQK